MKDRIRLSLGVAAAVLFEPSRSLSRSAPVPCLDPADLPNLDRSANAPTAAETDSEQTAEDGSCQSAKSVSRDADKALTEDDRRRSSRRRRHRLRDGLRSVTTLDRCRMCGAAATGRAPLAVVITAETAGWQGVQTCGSVSACPVCAPKIRQERAGEIEQGMRTHLGAGGGALFLTMTLRHTAGDRLIDLLPVVSGGLGRCLRGRAWVEMAAAIGYTGQIRSLEVTHGDSGWHPHVHALILTDTPLTDEQIAAVWRFIWERWSRHAERSTGRSVLPERMTLEPVREMAAIGQYLTKIVDDSGFSVGLEMTRTDLKVGRAGSRSAWQIAADAAAGDEVAAALWQEYEEATKGRRVVVWSRGLRARLGVGDEVPDEEIAAVGEVVPVEVVPVSEVEYRAVVRARATARVLDVAETEGAAGVRRLLAALVGAEPGARAAPPVWMERARLWAPPWIETEVCDGVAKA